MELDGKICLFLPKKIINQTQQCIFLPPLLNSTFKLLDKNYILRKVDFPCSFCSSRVEVLPILDILWVRSLYVAYYIQDQITSKITSLANHDLAN